MLEVSRSYTRYVASEQVLWGSWHASGVEGGHGMVVVSTESPENCTPLLYVGPSRTSKRKQSISSYTTISVQHPTGSKVEGWAPL